MLELGQARERLCAQAPQITEREWLDLCSGHLRFCADEVLALHAVPPEDNSAMDGYAVAASECQIDSYLPVSQHIAAGTSPQALRPGTAARILTGASIPPGADCVVIQENTTSSDGAIQFHKQPQEGDNIRPAGQDIARGAVVCQRGERIKAATLALLAATGHEGFWAVRRPRVALLNTGSELLEPGSPPQSGHIFNSNRPMLHSLLRQWGCDVVMTRTIPDDPKHTERCLHQAAERADLVVTSGGVSVGDEDHVKSAIQKLGSLDVWKVNLKPGKPLAFGHIKTTKGGTPVIGLPGNPVSSLIGALFFVRPFIWKMHGGETMIRPHQGIADFTLQRQSERPELMRALRNHHHLQLYPNQSSGVIRSLCWANALVWVEGNTNIQPGDQVPYYSLDEFN